MAIVNHKLGFGAGTLIEDTDRGTVKFRKDGDFMSSFEVRIADVTGISWRKNGLLSVTMSVNGQGSTLAEVKVGHGVTEKLDAWFKERIGLGATRIAPTSASAPIDKLLISDEIKKLAALHSEGILSDAEFTAAKQRLINQ
jgi:site-specific recombinase XerC